MLKVAAIIAVGMIIACMEVPALVKNRFVKEAWAFSLLLTAGITLGVLQVLHVPVPSLSEMITFIYKPVSDGILSLFKE